MIFHTFSFSFTSRFAVLDSGIGGLGLLRTIRSNLSGDNWMYFADTAYFPWGSHTIEDLAARLRQWASLLEKNGVTDLLLACNSACAAWEFSKLGIEFPQLCVHAVLDAGARTAVWSCAERVGIVATELTVKSGAYANAIRTYTVNRPIKITQMAAPGLADLLERGQFRGHELRRIIGEVVAPMLEARVQAIVLGCTHYPLCLDEWRNALPPEVDLIDPAHGLSASLRAASFGSSQPEGFPEQIFCSGDTESFSRAASQVLGRPVIARDLSPTPVALPLMV